MNSTNQRSAPSSVLQWYTRVPSSSQKNPERTTVTSSSSSYRRWWCTSRDLQPFARSILINLLGITILLCLSSHKPRMAIYLVKQMLFLTLTSNNTKWCAQMMSPSDQFSSSIDSSLSHLQLQQVTTVSLFQPSWVYKQVILDPIHSVSPLLLPRQYLLLYKSSPHYCLLLLDVACPDEKIMFLRFLARACQEVTRFCFASPLALLLPRPQVATSQVCPVPVFIAASSHPLWGSFLLLRAWTAIWYHISQLGLDTLVARFLLFFVAQVPALAAGVPLY